MRARRVKTLFLTACTCFTITATNQYFLNLFNKFKRPVAILDLRQDGWQEDLYALQHNAVVIVFCTNQEKINLLLRQKRKDRLIIFNQQIADSDIKLLGECEHFDITLVNAASHTNSEDLKNLGDFLITEQAVFAGMRTTLQRRHVFWHLGKFGKEHKIIRTFEQKNLIRMSLKNKQQLVSGWIPGINLLTFVTYNHIYPTNAQVLGVVRQLTKRVMYDWGPANMIVSGRKISLIDQFDFCFLNSTKILVENELSKLRAKMEEYYVLIKRLLTTTEDFDQKARLYWNVNAPWLKKIN